MRKFFLFFPIIFFSSQILQGQTLDATLLELNFSNDGYPEKLTKVQNGFYFSSQDDQLWFSDGTVENTSLVKDFGSGLYDDISLFTAVGDKVFFSAHEGRGNRELWVSDGTEQGTIQLTDRNASFSTENISDIIEYKGKVYFSAYDEVYGSELWVSDGTPIGTYVFKNIAENDTNSSPRDFFIFQEKLFFKAYTEDSNTEIWVSDGTPAGTTLLKDINEGRDTGVAYSNGYIVFKEYFYFFADDGTVGSELWKSDGTPGGTQLLKDINPGRNYSNNQMVGAVLNDKLVFAANDGIHGIELWITDGTDSETVLIKDVYPDYGNGLFYDSFNYQGVLQQANDKIFFSGTDGSDKTGLWITDGTELGTVFVHSGIPQELTLDSTGNSVLYYAPNGNNYDGNLWKSDGTPSGTQVLSEVKATNSSIMDDSFLLFDDRIFFSGNTKKNGTELWVTDGTSSGTELFFDVNHTYGVSPSLLTAVGDQLFFRGNQYGTYKLCVSDGTESGTRYLGNVSVGDEAELIDFNGKLAFSGSDGIHGNELWISDGTVEGTKMIKDIRVGGGDSMYSSDFVNSFAVYNQKLYFHANDGNGLTLWVSDGTHDGTYKLTTPGITALIGGNGATTFAGFDDHVYFFGQKDNGSDRGLYKVDLDTGENSFIEPFGAIEHIYATSNKLFIIQDNGVRSYPQAARELWASNGTSEGTRFLLKLQDRRIDHLTVFQDEFYFSAGGIEQEGNTLFKSNGTPEGTFALFTGEIPVTSYPFFDNLNGCGDYLYFGLEDNFGSIVELWRTDGTVNGTFKILGKEEGLFNTFSEFECFKENLFFRQYASKKIWFTNGQVDGVYGLDIDVTNGTSIPSWSLNLTAMNNKLFFAGSTDGSGSEIYVAEPYSISPEGQLTDGDSDGVIDLLDKCPDTPLGESVNEEGCAESQLDDDKDGITNTLDQCPATPIGETVDATGCSQNDLGDDDQDGVRNDMDICPLTPSGEMVALHGCSQSQLDDDGDGVMNNMDKCPETLPIYEVDDSGCPVVFELPFDNFTIQTVGVTCVNKGNGKVIISAKQPYNYALTIDGDEYNFTTSLTISNLFAGQYTLCITILEEPDFERCFNLEIKAASEISGKSTSFNFNNKTIETFEIESGTAPYSVSLNGKEVLKTSSTIFSVNAKSGDSLIVSSNFPCEGVLKKKVNSSQEVFVYPNPTNDLVKIRFNHEDSHEVVLKLYNTDHRLLLTKKCTISNGELDFSIGGRPSGIYFIRLEFDHPMTFKIIKK